MHALLKLWSENTVEPVLLHDVRQETFDAVREVYAVTPGILALTKIFVSNLPCSFAGYALGWDVGRQIRLHIVNCIILLFYFYFMNAVNWLEFFLAF